MIAFFSCRILDSRLDWDFHQPLGEVRERRFIRGIANWLRLTSRHICKRKGPWIKDGPLAPLLWNAFLVTRSHSQTYKIEPVSRGQLASQIWYLRDLLRGETSEDMRGKSRSMFELLVSSSKSNQIPNAQHTQTSLITNIRALKTTSASPLLGCSRSPPICGYPGTKATCLTFHLCALFAAFCNAANL